MYHRFAVIIVAIASKVLFLCYRKGGKTNTTDNRKITDYYPVRRSSRCTEAELKASVCCDIFIVSVQPSMYTATLASSQIAQES